MTFAKQQKYKPFINTKALRTRQIQGKHKDKTFAIQPLKSKVGAVEGPKSHNWPAGKVSPWKVIMLILIVMNMTTVSI